MARSWKDMIKSNVCSIKVFFKSHPGKTTATILEIDEKPPKKGEEPGLAMRIDVDDTWLRVNKSNALRLDKAYGENIDKWIGRKIIIEPTEIMFNDELVPSLLITPSKK